MKRRPKTKSREEIRKAIDSIFSSLSLKTVKEDLEKASKSQPLGNLRVEYDKEKRAMKVVPLFSKNDVVGFEEHGAIRKAVITAIGRDGIIARDGSNQQVKLRYNQIVSHKKRGKTL